MFEEIVISVASAITLVIVLINCLNCLFKKKGSQNYGPGISHNAQHNPAFSVDVSDVPAALERVTIEPLPDILSKTSSATSFRPRITCRGQQEALLLLNTLHKNFPRDHLTYLNEIGTGWFGQVIESEAAHIVDGSSKTKVVVRMLKEDATKIEQKYFMEEVSVYRCLDHVNLLSFLGQCTDCLPHLVILEFSPLGNLKSHLVYHRAEAEKLIKKNHLVTFALDIAAGLACLHRHDFVHNDLAARNCLVMSNYTVKIGDYGISDTLFKEDYYNTGRELLPIRWMAPETLVMANGMWTSNFGDKEADIWSFGVLLWEIFTFGEVPYSHLGDEAVVQGVVIDKTLIPSKSDLHVPMMNEIWSVMVQCFQNPDQRPNIELLHENMERIVKVDTIVSITDFDNRWEKLEPYRPELGSRTALAGSFNLDDLTPISDESFNLNGDSVTLNLQPEDDRLVDTNVPIGDNIRVNVALPVYNSQVQLIYEDETLSSNTSVKKVTPVPPSPVELVQQKQKIAANQPIDSLSSGDGSFSPLQSPLFSLQDESKISLLTNESNNNVLTLQLASHQPIVEEGANTSPKFPSNEFTDFQSALEVEPRGSDAGRDFSDFVSSFSEKRDDMLQVLETFTQTEIREEETPANVVPDKIVVDERNSSGEFTDFVTSLPPLSLNANTDNIFESSSFESSPGISKKPPKAEHVLPETIEYNFVDLMPDVGLGSQETREHNLVNFMPDDGLGSQETSEYNFVNLMPNVSLGSQETSEHNLVNLMPNVSLLSQETSEHIKVNIMPDVSVRSQETSEHNLVNFMPDVSLGSQETSDHNLVNFMPDVSVRSQETSEHNLVNFMPDGSLGSQETNEHKLMNLMPNVSLGSQETREHNLVSLMPDLNLPENTLPSDFSFMNELSSDPDRDVQQTTLEASHGLLDLQEMSNNIKISTSKELKNDLSELGDEAQPISQPSDLFELAKHGETDPVSDKVGRHDTQSHTPAVCNGFTSIDQILDSSSQELDGTFQVRREQEEPVVCFDDPQHNLKYQSDIIHDNTDIFVPSLSPAPDDTCLSLSPDPNLQDDSDTEVSTSSSSGQEYICSEEPAPPDPPPPQVFGTHSELDEHTLQMVSEIYLSRGVKSPRVFEIPPLETIYENQAIVEEDEEDLATANSDSSSEVRHDDQFGGDFEWDDLLNSDSPPRQPQRKLIPSKEQSFSEWSFDLEDDGWDNHSSIVNGSLSNSDFFSGNSSALAKHLLPPLPSSWPSVSHLNQTTLYSLMDDYPTDVTSPSEDNCEESVSSLSSPSVSPIANPPSSTPSAGPSLIPQSSHFLFPNNESSELPYSETLPSNQQILPSKSIPNTDSDHVSKDAPVLGADVLRLTEGLYQHSLLLDLPLRADESATALPKSQNDQSL